MNNKKIKWTLILGIPAAVILLIYLRFVLYYMTGGGFSGLSPLIPALLLCFILFAVCTSAFFAAWVYQDCKRRGDDPVLWAAVVFIATPFIGLLVYFLRRPELKRSCPACRHPVSLRAKYCEECGTHIENKEDTVVEKPRTHHLKFIAAGIVSMALMLACLIGFIVNAASGNGINTDPASPERVWNTGVVTMSYNNYFNNVWDFSFKSASDGYVEEQTLTIDDPGSQSLHADISCGETPDGSSLVLYLVQGDTVWSADVTALNGPLEVPLEQFGSGKVHVRLQINGVKDSTTKIFIE